MAKDKLKATIKNKNERASNRKQSKAELEKDVANTLAAMDMVETDSRHNMKTFKKK